MIFIEQDQQKSRILLNNPKEQLILNNILITNIHNHLYSEIHIIHKGEAVFIIDGVEYIVSENSAILIPPYCYHTVEAKTSPIERICFHAECDSNQIIVKSIPYGLISEIAAKIKEEEDIYSIYNHLFFILNELTSNNRFKLSPVKDYILQIREFFSLNYHRNIHLSDLAEELFLSSMQTQRLVKKYTGKTFGENLLTQRMTVAENLMKTTDMSLAEIAEYVGYSSYCGFWKAYKKYHAAESAGIQ